MTQTETLQKTKNRKRIDVGFLTMKLMTGLPRFAAMPLIRYDEEAAAWAVMNEGGRVTVGMDNKEGGGSLDMSQLPSYARNLLGDVANTWQMGLGYRLEETAGKLQRLRDSNPARFDEETRKRLGGWHNIGSLTYYAAFPSSRMPDAIRIQTAEALAQGNYGEVFVAWEAAWAEVLKLSLGAGRRQSEAPLDPIAFAQDKRDGFFYVLGTWDLTKLESYVVSEFTEKAS